MLLSQLLLLACGIIETLASKLPANCRKEHEIDENILEELLQIAKFAVESKSLQVIFESNGKVPQKKIIQTLWNCDKELANSS